jgi:hypothetical protein
MDSCDQPAFFASARIAFWSIPMTLSFRSSILCICLPCLLAASALAQKAAAAGSTLTADQDRSR